MDECTCCDETQSQTPASTENHAGLNALNYRIGIFSQFKAAMLARLPNLQPDKTKPNRPLRALTTREDHDPSIALLDSAAVMLDVLSFYQERIANEGYLRTATERGSVLELAHSVGYKLKPGVAASTHLAFTLEDAPGAPTRAPVPKGTKVQSLPGPNETPQIYETIEAMEARVEWNRLLPRTSVPQHIRAGLKYLYLQGIATGLQVGDPILIVGDERQAGLGSERWDLRYLERITPQPEFNRTLVEWSSGLGDAHTSPSSSQPKVFTFRLRAKLFGHNAPDPRTLPIESRFGTAITNNAWVGFAIGNTLTIDLDTTYPKIVAGSWIILADNKDVELYKVKHIHSAGRSDFALSGTVSRLDLDTNENLTQFGLRETVVLGQGEELALVEEPFNQPYPFVLEEGALIPVEGNEVLLSGIVLGLQKGQTLALSGKPIRVRVAQANLAFKPSSGAQGKILSVGESLQAFKAPVGTTWYLRDGEGVEGTVIASNTAFHLIPAAEKDALQSDILTLDDVPTVQDRAYSRLRFSKALEGFYDRSSVSLNANVAKASHGESKSEVLGSGDAAQRFQRFNLKQKPLTYTQAPTPSGAESTLEVRLNGVLWEEVPSLFGRGPKERIYTTDLTDDGTLSVQFGDGRTGARLPSGQENLSAQYRVGLGLGGLVKAGQLSLLMTRPLGVKSVTNPTAPLGAEDPEPRDQARRNAPFTVLTLDRIVSLSDYENFARAFGGIGKAQATALYRGERRLVHLSVAGINGAAIPTDSDLYKNLSTALSTFGDPHQVFRLQSYLPLTFKLSARLGLDPRYLAESVLRAAKQTLLQRYSFEQRGFAQGVSPSEVIAVLQGIAGVEFVDLETLEPSHQTPTFQIVFEDFVVPVLFKKDFKIFHKRPIFRPIPHPPVQTLNATPANWSGPLGFETQPAQLLTLDPRGLTLTEAKA